MIAALALTEVVEVRRNPHVLTADALVLGLQGRQLSLQVPDPLFGISAGLSRHLSWGRIHYRSGFWRSRGLSWGWGGVLGKRSRVAAHADRTGDLI